MSKDNSDGLGLSSILLIVFIILKLCKVINWSWLWVLSPAWISIGIYMIIYIIMAIIYKYL